MAPTRDPVNPKTPRLPLGWVRARPVPVLLGAMLVAVGLFGVWSRFDAYRGLEAEQRHLLAVQALAIDQNLSRQLAGVGAAMAGAREDLAVWTADEIGPRGTRRLEALCDAMPGVRAMLILDRDGRVLASNRPELAGHAVGGDAYFLHARAQNDPQRFFLSPPFVGVLGVHAMNLSIVVRATDGSFAGLIAATLDPDYFRIMLRATRYAPDVRAAVVHGDGQALMVEPPEADVVGQNVDQPGSFFRRHRESGRADSLLAGAAVVSGDRLMVALRTVRPAGLSLDKPIVVAVSRNLDAMFAPWWRQTLADAALYALLAVTASAGLIAMQRRQRAIDRLEAQREQSERKAAERLELALRGADLGLWDFDVRTGTSHVDPRWCSMLGLPHVASFSGIEGWSSRVHPDDRDRVLAAQQAHLDGRTERYEQIYRMRHAQGRWLWILDRGQVLERDAQGRPLRMVGTHMDTTERMQAHLALERSEQSLATTLYSIGDAVIATDPQGVVVRMNATAEHLTGWTAAQAIGQPLTDVFRIVDVRTREPAVDPVHQVIARGEVVSLANGTLLLGRDGREFQIADSAAPIRTPGGEITGVVLVFSDVTERYRVQQALRANEERLRSLLDNLGSGVIVHGPDTQVLDANPTACRIVGLTLDQMLGKVSIDPYWAFLEEDGSVMPHERFPVPQVLARGGPVKSLVLGVRRRDLERPLWVVVNAYPVLDDDGRIEQIVVTFSEITERREAEEELRLLAAAVARLSEVVIITGADPLAAPGPPIVFVNQAFERVTGWRRDEAMGRSPRFLQGPNTDPAELARISAALRRHEPVHAELVNYTRQGVEYWVELDIVPLADRSGVISHYVAVERDITERKQAEIERQALERQLREAQKIESIGTLAGGIAHDFNNILAAILGNVALAREDVPAGHPVVSSLDQINRAGLRARHLVQQILTFSRRDGQGLTWQPLRPIVDETLGLLRATLPAGVRLDAVLPELPLAVRGNATQLQQVLLNLCTNAWHALPEHGGRIEVGFERTTPDEAQRQRVPDLPPGACVHLWVRDNGSGMDAATRQRIFDPFFTTKTVGKGTGLGLSVVHGIVRTHEGTITLDTAPGRGTTFHIHFPLPDIGSVEPAVSERAPTAGSTGAGQRVLYIDDDEVMVAMVEQLLQRAGFRVTAFTDPGAAVAQLRAQPGAFDVVVTDFNMPELSGIDVAAQVARIRPGLPVVVSSGFISEALRAQATQAGVRALLQKENTVEELAGLLQQVLAQPAAWP